MKKWNVLVAGVDEAGRGALFGPLVAAAVILDPAQPINGLKDSKKLSPRRREELFYEIVNNSISWSFSLGTLEEIEEKNVLRATLLAMKRAIAKLNPVPDLVLVDGPYPPPGVGVVVRPIIGGDNLEPVISAASIVAKVIRDKIIIKMEDFFSGYELAHNKGYGTLHHRKFLDKFGPSPFHRETFVLKYLRGAK